MREYLMPWTFYTEKVLSIALIVFTIVSVYFVVKKLRFIARRMKSGKGQ